MGQRAHVGGLLGDRVTEVSARRTTVRIDHFASPEDFRDYFKSHYGPTIAVYRAIADDPDRLGSLDQELVDVGRRFAIAGDGFAMDWEYLLLTAHKSSTP